MATVRADPKAALIVIDAQIGVMDGAWEADRIIGNVALAVARARAEDVPVVWVQQTDDELPPGCANWRLVPALEPADGEPRIPKQFNSSFEDTDLETVLAQLGVSHLVLAGAATNWCIRATAYAALERGYDVTLISDAHTTAPMLLESGATIQAADIVRELNVVMQWLSYPGRRSRTATAGDLSFSIADVASRPA